MGFLDKVKSALGVGSSGSSESQSTPNVQANSTPAYGPVRYDPPQQSFDYSSVSRVSQPAKQSQAPQYTPVDGPYTPATTVRPTPRQYTTPQLQSPVQAQAPQAEPVNFTPAPSFTPAPLQTAQQSQVDLNQQSLTQPTQNNNVQGIDGVNFSSQNRNYTPILQDPVQHSIAPDNYNGPDPSAGTKEITSKYGSYGPADVKRPPPAEMYASDPKSLKEQREDLSRFVDDKKAESEKDARENFKISDIRNRNQRVVDVFDDMGFRVNDEKIDNFRDKSVKVAKRGLGADWVVDNAKDKNAVARTVAGAYDSLIESVAAFPSDLAQGLVSSDEQKSYEATVRSVGNIIEIGSYAPVVGWLGKAGKGLYLTGKGILANGFRKEGRQMLLNGVNGLKNNWKGYKRKVIDTFKNPVAKREVSKEILDNANFVTKGYNIGKNGLANSFITLGNTGVGRAIRSTLYAGLTPTFGLLTKTVAGKVMTKQAPLYTAPSYTMLVEPTGVGRFVEDFTTVDGEAISAFGFAPSAVRTKEGNDEFRNSFMKGNNKRLLNNAKEGDPFFESYEDKLREFGYDVDTSKPFEERVKDYMLMSSKLEDMEKDFTQNSFQNVADYIAEDFGKRGIFGYTPELDPLNTFPSRASVREQADTEPGEFVDTPDGGFVLPDKLPSVGSDEYETLLAQMEENSIFEKRSSDQQQIAVDKYYQLNAEKGIDRVSLQYTFDMTATMEAQNTHLNNLHLNTINALLVVAEEDPELWAKHRDDIVPILQKQESAKKKINEYMPYYFSNLESGMKEKEASQMAIKQVYKEDSLSVAMEKWREDVQMDGREITSKLAEELVDIAPHSFGFVVRPTAKVSGAMDGFLKRGDDADPRYVAGIRHLELGKHISQKENLRYSTTEIAGEGGTLALQMALSRLGGKLVGGPGKLNRISAGIGDAFEEIAINGLIEAETPGQFGDNAEFGVGIFMEMSNAGISMVNYGNRYSSKRYSNMTIQEYELDANGGKTNSDFVKETIKTGLGGYHKELLEKEDGQLSQDEFEALSRLNDNESSGYDGYDQRFAKEITHLEQVIADKHKREYDTIVEWETHNSFQPINVIERKNATAISDEHKTLLVFNEGMQKKLEDLNKQTGSGKLLGADGRYDGGNVNKLIKDTNSTLDSIAESKYTDKAGNFDDVGFNADADVQVARQQMAILTEIRTLGNQYNKNKATIAKSSDYIKQVGDNKVEIDYGGYQTAVYGSNPQKKNISQTLYDGLKQEYKTAETVNGRFVFGQELQVDPAQTGSVSQPVQNQQVNIQANLAGAFAGGSGGKDGYIKEYKAGKSPDSQGGGDLVTVMHGDTPRQGLIRRNGTHGVLVEMYVADPQDPSGAPFAIQEWFNFDESSSGSIQGLWKGDQVKALQQHIEVAEGKRKEGDVDEILTFVASKAGITIATPMDADETRVYKKLSDIYKNLRSLFPSGSPIVQYHSAGSYYNRDTNTIYLDERLSPEMQKRVFMHEMLHALNTTIIENGEAGRLKKGSNEYQYYNAIKGAWLVYRNAVDKGTIKTRKNGRDGKFDTVMYDSLYEFSVSFFDPVMKKRLGQINSTSKVKENLWKRLMRDIKKFLGLNTDTNLYEIMVGATEAILEDIHRSKREEIFNFKNKEFGLKFRQTFLQQFGNSPGFNNSIMAMLNDVEDLGTLIDNLFLTNDAFKGFVASQNQSSYALAKGKLVADYIHSIVRTQEFGIHRKLMGANLSAKKKSELFLGSLFAFGSKVGIDKVDNMSGKVGDDIENSYTDLVTTIANAINREPQEIYGFMQRHKGHIKTITKSIIGAKIARRELNDYNQKLSGERDFNARTRLYEKYLSSFLNYLRKEVNGGLTQQQFIQGFQNIISQGLENANSQLNDLNNDYQGPAMSYIEKMLASYENVSLEYETAISELYEILADKDKVDGLLIEMEAVRREVANAYNKGLAVGTKNTQQALKFFNAGIVMNLNGFGNLMNAENFGIESVKFLGRMMGIDSRVSNQFDPDTILDNVSHLSQYTTFLSDPQTTISMVKAYLSRGDSADKWRSILVNEYISSIGAYGRDLTVPFYQIMRDIGLLEDINVYTDSTVEQNIIYYVASVYSDYIDSQNILEINNAELTENSDIKNDIVKSWSKKEGYTYKSSQNAEDNYFDGEHMQINYEYIGDELFEVGEDTDFNPNTAKLSDGKSIERHFQVNVKGYESIKAGKGNPPKSLKFKTQKTPRGTTLLDSMVEEADSYIMQTTNGDEFGENLGVTRIGWKGTENGVIVLHRAWNLAGAGLSPELRTSIAEARDKGNRFIVNDKDADAPLIRILESMGADFTIHHTGTVPRLGLVDSQEDIFQQYKALWDRYLKENPKYKARLKKKFADSKIVLNDKNSERDTNPAKALGELLGIPYADRAIVKPSGTKGDFGKKTISMVFKNGSRGLQLRSGENTIEAIKNGTRTATTRKMYWDKGNGNKVNRVDFYPPGRVLLANGKGSGQAIIRVTETKALPKIQDQRTLKRTPEMIYPIGGPDSGRASFVRPFKINPKFAVVSPRSFLTDGEDMANLTPKREAEIYGKTLDLAVVQIKSGKSVMFDDDNTSSRLRARIKKGLESRLGAGTFSEGAVIIDHSGGTNQVDLTKEGYVILDETLRDPSNNMIANFANTLNGMFGEELVIVDNTFSQPEGMNPRHTLSQSSFGGLKDGKIVVNLNGLSLNDAIVKHPPLVFAVMKLYDKDLAETLESYYYDTDFTKEDPRNIDLLNSSMQWLRNQNVIMQGFESIGDLANQYNAEGVHLATYAYKAPAKLNFLAENLLQFLADSGVEITTKSEVIRATHNMLDARLGNKNWNDPSIRKGVGNANKTSTLGQEFFYTLAVLTGREQEFITEDVLNKLSERDNVVEKTKDAEKYMTNKIYNFIKNSVSLKSETGFDFKQYDPKNTNSVLTEEVRNAMNNEVVRVSSKTTNKDYGFKHRMVIAIKNTYISGRLNKLKNLGIIVNSKGQTLFQVIREYESNIINNDPLYAKKMQAVSDAMKKKVKVPKELQFIDQYNKNVLGSLTLNGAIFGPTDLVVLPYRQLKKAGYSDTSLRKGEQKFGLKLPFVGRSAVYWRVFDEGDKQVLKFVNEKGKEIPVPNTHTINFLRDKKEKHDIGTMGKQLVGENIKVHNLPRGLNFFINENGTLDMRADRFFQPTKLKTNALIGVPEDNMSVAEVIDNRIDEAKKMNDFVKKTRSVSEQRIAKLNGFRQNTRVGKVFTAMNIGKNNPVVQEIGIKNIDYLSYVESIYNYLRVGYGIQIESFYKKKQDVAKELATSVEDGTITTDEILLTMFGDTENDLSYSIVSMGVKLFNDGDLLGGAVPDMMKTMQNIQKGLEMFGIETSDSTRIGKDLETIYGYITSNETSRQKYITFDGDSSAGIDVLRTEQPELFKAMQSLMSDKARITALLDEFVEKFGIEGLANIDSDVNNLSPDEVSKKEFYEGVFVNKTKSLEISVLLWLQTQIAYIDTSMLINAQLENKEFKEGPKFANTLTIAGGLGVGGYLSNEVDSENNQKLSNNIRQKAENFLINGLGLNANDVRGSASNLNKLYFNQNPRDSLGLNSREVIALEEYLKRFVPLKTVKDIMSITNADDTILSVANMKNDTGNLSNEELRELGEKNTAIFTDAEIKLIRSIGLLTNFYDVSIAFRVGIDPAGMVGVPDAFAKVVYSIDPELFNSLGQEFFIGLGEAIQETNMRARKGLDKSPAEVYLETWLNSIPSNALRDMHRLKNFHAFTDFETMKAIGKVSHRLWGNIQSIRLGLLAQKASKRPILEDNDVNHMLKAIQNFMVMKPIGSTVFGIDYQYESSNKTYQSESVGIDSTIKDFQIWFSLLDSDERDNFMDHVPQELYDALGDDGITQILEERFDGTEQFFGSNDLILKKELTDIINNSDKDSLKDILDLVGHKLPPDFYSYLKSINFKKNRAGNKLPPAVLKETNAISELNPEKKNFIKDLGKVWSIGRTQSLDVFMRNLENNKYGYMGEAFLPQNFIGDLISANPNISNKSIIDIQTGINEAGEAQDMGVLFEVIREVESQYGPLTQWSEAPMNRIRTGEFLKTRSNQVQIGEMVEKVDGFIEKMREDTVYKKFLRFPDHRSNQMRNRHKGENFLFTNPVLSYSPTFSDNGFIDSETQKNMIEFQEAHNQESVADEEMLETLDNCLDT